MRLPSFLVDPDITEPEDHREPGARRGSLAPVPLKIAAGAVALEGLFAVVFGAFEALNVSSSRAVMGVTTALFFVVFGAGLVFCAWGLSTVRSWARGPVMLAQLMSLGLAWNFRGDETGWISVVLAIPAVIGLIGMLHPRTIEVLSD